MGDDDDADHGTTSSHFPVLAARFVFRFVFRFGSNFDARCLPFDPRRPGTVARTAPIRT